MAEEDSVEQTVMPEYKESSTDMMRNQVPRSLLPPEGWNETLQSIELTWAKGEEMYADRMRMFTEAVALPNVPEVEKKDVMKYMTLAEENYQDLVNGIQRISQGEKLKWSEIKELAKCVDALQGKGRNEDEQAIAMSEAISETHVEGRLRKDMVRDLTRHAYSEIFRVGDYRTLDYTGTEEGEIVEDRTTQDVLSVEKNQLVYALKNDAWKGEDLNELKKLKNAWKRVCTQGDNDVDPKTANKIEKLWQACMGKPNKTESGLDYLQLAEDIYKDLEQGGAFDIDIYEAMEEMEDLDEEDEEPDYEVEEN